MLYVMKRAFFIKTYRPELDIMVGRRRNDGTAERYCKEGIELY